MGQIHVGAPGRRSVQRCLDPGRWPPRPGQKMVDDRTVPWRGQLHASRQRRVADRCHAGTVDERRHLRGTDPLPVPLSSDSACTTH